MQLISPTPYASYIVVYFLISVNVKGIWRSSDLVVLVNQSYVIVCLALFVTASVTSSNTHILFVFFVSLFKFTFLIFYSVLFVVLEMPEELIDQEYNAICAEMEEAFERLVDI